MSQNDSLNVGLAFLEIDNAIREKALKPFPKSAKTNARPSEPAIVQGTMDDLAYELLANQLDLPQEGIQELNSGDLAKIYRQMLNDPDTDPNQLAVVENAYLKTVADRVALATPSQGWDKVLFFPPAG